MYTICEVTRVFPSEVKAKAMLLRIAWMNTEFNKKGGSHTVAWVGPSFPAPLPIYEQRPGWFVL